VLVGVHDSLHPVPEPELIQHPADVCLDCGLGQEELGGDLGVRQARCDLDEDLPFTGGERVEPGRLRQLRFRAEGEVQFPSAHITGGLYLTGAHLDGSLGRSTQAVSRSKALSAKRLTVDGDFYCQDLTVTGAVDLSFGKVKVLNHEPGEWPERLLLDGFTYDDLQPYVAARGNADSGPGRLSWLARGESDFRAQPYELITRSSNRSCTRLTWSSHSSTLARETRGSSQEQASGLQRY
jgi:hypothetical protein